MSAGFSKEVLAIMKMDDRHKVYVPGVGEVTLGDIRLAVVDRDARTCPHCGAEFPTRGKKATHQARCGTTPPPGRRVGGRPYAKPGQVYIFETLEGPPRIKVGFTQRGARERLLDIANACPVALQIRGAWSGSAALEFDLHTRLEPFRIRAEWFDHAATAVAEQMIADAGCLRVIPDPVLEP